MPSSPRTAASIHARTSNSRRTAKKISRSYYPFESDDLRPRNDPYTVVPVQLYHRLGDRFAKQVPEWEVKCLHKDSLLAESPCRCGHFETDEAAPHHEDALGEPKSFAQRAGVLEGSQVEDAPEFASGYLQAEKSCTRWISPS